MPARAGQGGGTSLSHAGFVLMTVFAVQQLQQVYPESLKGQETAPKVPALLFAIKLRSKSASTLHSLVPELPVVHAFCSLVYVLQPCHIIRLRRVTEDFHCELGQRESENIPLVHSASIDLSRRVLVEIL